MWRSAEVNAMRVWQHLSQSWPTDLMAEPSSSTAYRQQPNIQCHRGMATMAAEVAQQISPHIASCPGVVRRILADISARLPRKFHTCCRSKLHL